MSSANVYFVEFEQVYIYFDVFCLNFSIEMKIKTIFLISYFNLSKKNRNGTLGTRIVTHERRMLI